jgi:hypothetical protein
VHLKVLVCKFASIMLLLAYRRLTYPPPPPPPPPPHHTAENEGTEILTVACILIFALLTLAVMLTIDIALPVAAIVVAERYKNAPCEGDIARPMLAGGSLSLAYGAVSLFWRWTNTRKDKAHRKCSI